MSFSLLHQLNTTLKNLEIQAFSDTKLSALLLWYTQPEQAADFLENLLADEAKAEATNSPETEHQAASSGPALENSPAYQRLKTATSQDIEECYQALSELSTLDMARFSFVQEFGSRFQDNPFYNGLLHAIARRV